MREKYPGVRIDVQFIGNEAMKLGLNNFALDVALTYLDKADLGRKNTLPIYTEQLSLLVSDTPEFQKRKMITWKEAGQLPLAMLRPSMHERRFVDQVFASVGCTPVARVESESILHLMFQVQFTELCTIIPSHFVHAPGLHRGTRALPLVDPVVSQDVGLFWADGEIVLPMANAFVSIVQTLNKSGELRKRLEGDHAADLRRHRSARARTSNARRFTLRVKRHGGPAAMNFIAVAAGSLSASRAATRQDRLLFAAPIRRRACIRIKETVRDFAQSPGENPKSAALQPRAGQAHESRGSAAGKRCGMVHAGGRRRPRGPRRHCGTRPPIASRPCRHDRGE